MIRVPIAAAYYTVHLIRGHCRMPDGRPCLGRCDPDRREVQVSDVPPPPRRREVLHHELHHALIAEQPLGCPASITEEQHCELASRLWIHPLLYGRLIAYIERGWVPDAVAWLPGEDSPRPLTPPPAKADPLG